MDKNENMTALMSAFARAYHTEHNEITMYSDPLAHRILGEEDYTALARNIVGGIKFFEPNFSGTDDEALRAAVEKRLAPGVTARSFFAERALRTEVSLRTKQYIILGAGLDTFAYRRPEWAKDLEIFEVDMPKMIDSKLKRLKQVGLSDEKTHYIAADLAEKDWISHLLCEPSFSAEKVSFVSALGLSFYIDKEDFFTLISTLAEHLPHGSALVFDYAAADSEYHSEKAALAAAAGERMSRAYTIEELELGVPQRGFRIYENIGAYEINTECFKEFKSLHGFAAPEGIGYCLCVRK